MCRRFVSRVGTSVAGGTNSGGLIMREWHNKHCPYISGMARFTEFRGLRMCRGFIRSGTDAIMTPRTVTRLPRHCTVVKQNLQFDDGVLKLQEEEILHQLQSIFQTYTIKRF